MKALNSNLSYEESEAYLDLITEIKKDSIGTDKYAVKWKSHWLTSPVEKQDSWIIGEEMTFGCYIGEGTYRVKVCENLERSCENCTERDKWDSCLYHCMQSVKNGGKNYYFKRI